MKTIKLGIFGLGRGSGCYSIVKALGGEVVAVCETNQTVVDGVYDVAEDITLKAIWDDLYISE